MVEAYISLINPIMEQNASCFQESETPEKDRQACNSSNTSTRKMHMESKEGQKVQLSLGQKVYKQSLAKFLEKMPGTAVQAEPGTNHSELLHQLEQKLMQMEDQGVNFGLVGTNFPEKVGQQCRDNFQNGAIDLYAEFSSDGSAQGTYTIVLDRDPALPHKGPTECFSNAIKEAYFPFLGKLLKDLGEVPVDWNMRMSGEVEIEFGAKTPDILFYSEPPKEKHKEALIGEICFRHETLFQLLLETQLNLELTNAKVSFALSVTTSSDSSLLWKKPRMELFAFQHVPSSGSRIISGPLRLGEGSQCNCPGQQKYAMKLKKGLLLSNPPYPNPEMFLTIDLFSFMQEVEASLQSGTGRLSSEKISLGHWRARHKDILEYASNFGFRRQNELTDEEKEDLWLILESDEV